MILSRRFIICVYSSLAIVLVACVVSHLWIAHQVAARTARRAAAEGAMIPRIRIDAASNPNLLASLQSLSHTTIVLDPKMNLDVAVPVTQELFNVRFDLAMDTLLSQASADEAIDWWWRGEEIVIGGEPSVNLRVYDVRDLFKQLKDDLAGWPKPPPAMNQSATFGPATLDQERGPYDEWTDSEVIEELTKIIEDSVEPDTWRDAGGVLGSLQLFDGRLFIEHTEAAHRKIAKLLADLRAKHS